MLVYSCNHESGSDVQREASGGKFPGISRFPGNGREILGAREFPSYGNFPFPGNSRGTGNSRAAGNSRTTGIPEPREFPEAREFPGKREFPVKNARAADRNVHSCQLRVILSCVPVVQWQLRAFETTQTCTHEHVLGGQGCELCVCIECVAVA